MNRHELRDRSFKLLFRKEFNSPEDMPEQVRLFCSDPEYGTSQDEDSEFVRSRYDNIISRIEEIDSIIDDNSEGWKTDRMGKVELSLLRLAVYEMLFDDDIPTAVAMDEAVELAKTYGQDNSGAFVNAILTKVKESKKLG
jgi:N utilization substance protein B